MLELLNENCFQFKGDSNLDLWPCDPKINRGSSTQYRQSSYEVWILWTKWNLSYAAETIFSFMVIVTLTFDPVTPKSIGVFYPIWTIILWSLKTVGKRNLSYAPETIFSIKLIVTLTFDLVTPKSIGVFYLIWTIILWSLNKVGQMELKLCSGNHFQYLANSDLDLWPCDPKINRGLLPNMDNHPMKFENCGPNGT
jgi:hypothetical protein